MATHEPVGPVLSGVEKEWRVMSTTRSVLWPHHSHMRAVALAFMCIHILHVLAHTDCASF